MTTTSHPTTNQQITLETKTVRFINQAGTTTQINARCIIRDTATGRRIAHFTATGPDAALNAKMQALRYIVRKKGKVFKKGLTRHPKKAQ